MKTTFLKVTLFALCLAGPLQAVPQVSHIELAGAKATIASPTSWQGKVVLLAHGYREVVNPLEANIETDGEFAVPLLEKGWALAATSYRRNGWVIEDAIDDLKALLTHLQRTHGEVKRVILVGNSMGGLIATLCAEGAMTEISGVVSIGAYLGDENFKQGEYYPKLTWKPERPLLFLTNQTELAHSRAYCDRAKSSKTAFWRINRNGHCNVSDAERLKAVLAVDAWLSGENIEREADGTLAPPDRTSTATAVENGLKGTARKVSESWGNITTSFVAADLLALGLKLKDRVMVHSTSEPVEFIYCEDRREVSNGQGALILTPDGWVQLSINGGRAAEKLGIKQTEALSLGKAHK